MRIAFIMLCHKNPEQINHLIQRLSEFRDADVYIHVDRKSAGVRERIDSRSNVFLLPEERSFRVQWGSVDIVRATLQLIREVRDSGKAYDYLWLLSGQDYPICPVRDIEKRLASQPGLNYIDTIVPEQDGYLRHKKLCEIAYPPWINGNTFAVKAIKRVYMLLTGGYQHSFPLFIRRKPFDFDFVFGSQWWVLTPEAAYDILAYSDAHPEVLDYYKKCIIPDECFFQTLFMRGPFHERRAENLTYINWGKDPRSPEILVLHDWEKLRQKAKTFCFARKFELDESAALMERLSAEES